MEGVPEALAAGEAAGVRVVPAVELSVRPPSGSMHLLGYFRGTSPQPLTDRIGAIAAYRSGRNMAIVRRLGELGVPVAWSDVERRASGRVGRPHIAAALVAAGHVASMQEAFERWIGDDGPAYVDSGSLSAQEAVTLVAESGGAPVLAHPASLRMEPVRLGAFVAELAAAGLRGIEVYRPDHDAVLRDAYAAICARTGLVPCGGSDFHRDAPECADVGDCGPAPLPPDTAERLLRD
jgi:3',5'-nucleoside bisphosphate phosphatase